MLDILITFLSVLFFMYLGYKPQWHKEKHIFKPPQVQDIPGPISLPILGTRWLFSFGKYEMNKLHLYYEDMKEKYGRIFKEEALFNVPVISVFEKNDIEKVLRSTGKYPIRPPTEAIAKYRSEHPERYASTGLTNEQGEKWHQLRISLTTVLTSPKTINDFLPQLEAVADDWCYLIKKMRNGTGRVEKLEELAGRLGLEATCALVLGRRMGFLIEDQSCEMAEKLAHAVHQNFIACRDTYYGLPFWKLFSTDVYNRLCQSENDIYEFASDIINSADEAKDSAVFQSVINAHIDEREKKSAIVDFLAAGIHTLKNSLLFLLYQVAMNPDCQKKILLDKNYLKACSMETYRLTPTVNALARVTESDLELAGYKVKAGTVVLCHTAQACREERNFNNALQFLPERWLGDNKTDSAAFLVTPFGYGKRICPGKRFIEQALPVVLEKIVEKFQITVDKPMELEFEFLLAPKGHVSMSFMDRF